MLGNKKENKTVSSLNLTAQRRTTFVAFSFCLMIKELFRIQLSLILPTLYLNMKLRWFIIFWMWFVTF